MKYSFLYPLIGNHNTVWPPNYTIIFFMWDAFRNQHPATNPCPVHKAQYVKSPSNLELREFFFISDFVLHVNTFHMTKKKENLQIRQMYKNH